jgi:hypothetical protein
MTTTVEPWNEMKKDDEEYCVQVKTTCAAGKTRRYRIGIAENQMVDGEYVMHGKRVDGGAPAKPSGGGPSDNAWEAAAKRLKAAGYEVFGR